MLKCWWPFILPFWCHRGCTGDWWKTALADTRSLPVAAHYMSIFSTVQCAQGAPTILKWFCPRYVTALPSCEKALKHLQSVLASRRLRPSRTGLTTRAERCSLVASLARRGSPACHVSAAQHLDFQGYPKRLGFPRFPAALASAVTQTGCN